MKNSSKNKTTGKPKRVKPRCPVCDTTAPFFKRGKCSICGYEKPKKVKAKKPPKPKRPKPKPEKKPEPSERELVHKYVKRVIKNQVYHGRVDTDKFKGLEYKKPNKNIWLDTDFYFSVVFQTTKQKIDFLKALAIEDAVEIGDGNVKIVNGFLLAAALGIDLEKEKVSGYPLGNIELRPFVLNEEEI